MESNIYSQHPDRDLRDFTIAFVATELFMVLFFLDCKVYDLATAALFAFGLGLIARGKLLQYLGVFTLANINRETSILLTAVFMIYSIGRLGWLDYILSLAGQGLIAGGIRLLLMAIYADNPGVDMLVRPMENLARFTSSTTGSLVHWAAFAVVIWLCLRRWRSASRIQQVAFVVMVPALMFMYLVLGVSFEVRVFAEVFPVVWAIIFSKL